MEKIINKGRLKLSQHYQKHPKKEVKSVGIFEAFKKEMPVYSLLLLLRVGEYKSFVPKEEALFYNQLL